MEIKYLVIGNKGSFLDDFLESFKSKSQGSTVDVIFVNTPMEKNWMDSSIEGCHAVIYLGGETRFEEKMDYLNYQIPKEIFEKCSTNNIRLYYLSSLSVFGYSRSDNICSQTDRNPIDFYGITKNKFDIFVKENSSQFSDVCAFYPASIDSGKGRSSVEKFENLMSKYNFLRFFSLSGKLSIISRSELIDNIISAVKSDVTGDYILSRHVDLCSYSSDYALKVPRLPIVFFDIIGFLLGKKLSLLARTLNRGIHYGCYEER